MTFPPDRVRIMVATKPLDFRKGHESLAAMVKNDLCKDAEHGEVVQARTCTESLDNSESTSA